MTALGKLGVWADTEVASACVVVMNERGEILVVREPKFTGHLGLPGGKRENITQILTKGARVSARRVQFTESIQECAAREAREEAGVIVTKMEHVVRMHVGGFVCDCFLAREWQFEPSEEPHATRAWVHPTRLLEHRGTRFPEFNAAMMPYLVSVLASKPCPTKRRKKKG